MAQENKDLVLRLGPGGCGSVVVGGHDISDWVTGGQLDIKPGSGSELRLELAGCEVDATADPGKVRLAAPLRDALVALGWTPPEGQ